MKFRSNRCIAIHLPSLAKAERFYSEVMGFKLKSKSGDHLEYATGKLRLYVNRSRTVRPPVPSFDVKSQRAAKLHLKKAGCRIVTEGKKAFYFRDPFGVVYDVIEM
jgi:catechol 2,3-dioxygenase-like lactoylglutathione lyase family enzyme